MYSVYEHSGARLAQTQEWLEQTWFGWLWFGVVIWVMEQGQKLGKIQSGLTELWDILNGFW